MLERLLLGVLALGLPDGSRNWTNHDGKAEGFNNLLVRIQNSAKLHVGMLSISLIVCLAFGGYVGYSYWTEKSNLLAHARNLVIAFICRIFFSILFDGVVILGSGTTVQGANTLLAFECICQNLVFAFWLMLTVYLHERVQSKFNSEPSLTLCEYGIPGVAVFFALVWIFALQAEVPSALWWLFSSLLPQWIVCSLRLLYLLIQLGLVVDMGRTMLKTPLDNDTVSLLRKSVAVLAGLILLFWLQFGLSLARLPWKTSQSYQYFDYFIDGSQGGLFCLGFFFFNLWVSMLLSSKPNILVETGETTPPTYEVLLNGVETIDNVFKGKERGSWKSPQTGGESSDVMYSTVVEPHRLQKTLDLYKRLNILPNSQTTVLDGEQYHDCQTRSIVSEAGDSDKVDFHSVLSDDFKSHPVMNKNTEQVQKKNAFYASKYLIVDSKESDIPKLLETRPSVSSVGKEGGKEDRLGRACLPGLESVITDELVNKWLNDISVIRQAKTKSGPEQAHQNLGEEAKGYQQNLPQTPTQEVDNESNKSHSTKSGVTSVMANTTNDSNKNVTEHQEKHPYARTLIQKETTIFNLPIVRNYFDGPSKRKLSNESGLPNKPKTLGSNSGVDVASFLPQEVGSSLSKEPSEVHEEPKRRKTTHDPDEHHQPRPVPRRIDKPTPRGTAQEPQLVREGKFTPTPGDLPYSELPSATQSGRLSGVIHSTFNSLLNIGDGLFRSKSTAETNLEIPVERKDERVMPERDEHFDDDFRREALPERKSSYTVANSHAPKADTASTAPDIQHAEDEVKHFRNPVLELQSSKPVPMEVEKKVELSTGQEMQKPRETQVVLDPPNSVPSGDDSSSESNFSIEKIDSTYYAGLMKMKEKVSTYQHPFAMKLKHSSY